MKAIGLSLGAALVATVNGGHWRTFAAHRVSVSYPPGWYATSAGRRRRVVNTLVVR